MYTIGIDYGTESGRALLVDTRDGREVATAVHAYKNGVIDQALPGSTKPLPLDWALQDPNDYLEVLRRTIPAVLKERERTGLPLPLRSRRLLLSAGSATETVPSACPQATGEPQGAAVTEVPGDG